MSIASYFHVVSLSVLEEQLAASHHEEEATCLWGFIIVEDHKRAAVAGVRQEASVALDAMQL